jgi:phospholipid/cholesterol/gamma-HCH transport system substrate-binding protein
MKKKEVQQDIKLGLFVLVGVVLFLAAVFMIGSENNIFARTFRIYAVFKNVEGLKDGDNVWLSGVKIGTVREVRIVSLGRVIVELSLKDKQNQFLKKNATAFIGSDGLVGNKIVVIRPGDARQTLQHEDTIGAFSPADTQELINIARDVGQNTRSLTDDLKTLTQKINEGKGIVGELLQDGPIAQDMRKVVDQMATTTDRTSRASAELYAMMHKLNHGEGLANRLVTDTTLADVFDETLNNVRAVSRNSADMTRTLEVLVSKLNDGNNAIGLLLADTTFASQMRTTLQNAKTASAKLDENMEAMRHNFLLRGYFRKKEKAKNKK